MPLASGRSKICTAICFEIQLVLKPVIAIFGIGIWAIMSCCMKKKRLFFWLVYLLVILLFQEVLFRWLFPLPELRDFNRSNYMHPPRGVAEIAPLRYECHTFQSYPDTVYRFAHHLNGYGFRDKEWRVKKKKGKKRIVFIGDSFV